LGVSQQNSQGKQLPSFRSFTVAWDLILLKLFSLLTQVDWTNFTDPVATYGHATSNLVESAHASVGAEARKQPPSTLVFGTMRRDAEWNRQRAASAGRALASGRRFTPLAEDLFEEQRGLSSRYKVSAM